MSNLLELTSVIFSHSDKNNILSNINFQLHDNATTALIGPNGAGKSTLLKIIGNILFPSLGEVLLNRKPIHQYSRRELAGQISYLPQRYSLQPSQIVNEFVLMSRYFQLSRFASPSSKDRKIVSEALELTESTSLSNRFLGELSGGEQQRILWASVIAQRTPIILLDEPFQALDPKYQDRMIELLQYIKKERQVATIVATHDINIALACSENALALKRGEQIFFGTCNELVASRALEDIYDKKFTRVKTSLRRIYNDTTAVNL